MSNVAEDVDDASFGDDDGVAGADEDIGVEGIVGAIGKESADPFACFASALNDDMAIGVFGEPSGEREHVDEGTGSGDAYGARVSDLAENGDGLGGVFLDKNGNLRVKKVIALAVLFGDAGPGCGGRESLNGDIAGESEGDFAGVEDADALVQLGFAENGDAEKVAGSNEEAFRCCAGSQGRLGLAGWSGGGLSAGLTTAKLPEWRPSRMPVCWRRPSRLV